MRFSPLLYFVLIDVTFLFGPYRPRLTRIQILLDILRRRRRERTNRSLEGLRLERARDEQLRDSTFFFVLSLQCLSSTFSCLLRFPQSSFQFWVSRDTTKWWGSKHLFKVQLLQQREGRYRFWWEPVLIFWAFFLQLWSLGFTFII